MHVRVGGCGHVLCGISSLITFIIILTIPSTFTLVKIFCQYTENCWEKRPNVQAKENLSAQYAVKIVPRRVYVQEPLGRTRSWSLSPLRKVLIKTSHLPPSPHGSNKL